MFCVYLELNCYKTKSPESLKMFIGLAYQNNSKSSNWVSKLVFNCLNDCGLC
ncbi:hypothetical protein ADIWIN_1867 [Winogradskyella psychrotolerans RS-3]|uniref:Uncharacterized protein n=1 Tax=Winogradskyella psychrotolerans RS-3 TaxID=641526 RepID=S7VSR3_9FLAO|nr:hypothetical protein ADIWIN_1867 [Winogradskyella psychrotolerans RS-3]